MRATNQQHANLLTKDSRERDIFVVIDPLNNRYSLSQAIKK